MFKPDRIISGGQTGVDYGALRAARKLGIQTGGWAPRGYRTEDGSREILGTVYGLSEHTSIDYAPRTFANVCASHATLIIQVERVRSPGSILTRSYCEDLGTEFYVVLMRSLYEPKPVPRVKEWLEAIKPKILNVAGHRESSVHGIELWTEDYIRQLFDENYKQGGHE